MTRFARAKGSKASNERKEEDPTPWHVMRQQLAEQSNQNDDGCGKKSSFADDITGMVDLKPKEEFWSEFNEFKFQKPNLIVDTKSETAKMSIKRQNEKVCKKKTNKIKVDGVSNNDCMSDIKEGPAKTIIRPHQNVYELESRKSTDSKTKRTINLGNIHSEPTANNKPKYRKNSKNSYLPPNKKTSTGEIIKDKGLTNKNLKTNKLNTESNENELKTNKLKTLEDANTEEQTRLTPISINDETSNTLQTPEHLVTNISTNANKKSLKVANNNKGIKNEAHIHSNRFSRSAVETIIANGRKIEIVRFEAFWVKKDDATKLKKLRKKLRDQKMPNDKIKTIIKLERRKAEKALSREKTNVCYHCRKFGHKFSECPEINDSSMSKSGICFKCGSTEHTHFECKVTQSQNFRYAVCFVCNEQGHIARQCTLNPQGQYPKGGSCHLCGEITHLRKDCPKAFEEKPSSLVTVEMINSIGLEDVSEMKTNTSKHNLVKNKVVLF